MRHALDSYNELDMQENLPESAGDLEIVSRFKNASRLPMSLLSDRIESLRIEYPAYEIKFNLFKSRLY